jgi:hypothetical protein
MPTTRRRKTRERTGAHGLPEGAFEYFLSGPFFEDAPEAFEKMTTPSERRELWRTHKAVILEHFHTDPRNAGHLCYGENVEIWEAETNDAR